MSKLKLVGLEHSQGSLIDEVTGKTINWDYIKVHALAPMEQPKNVTSNAWVGERPVLIKLPATQENFNLFKTIKIGSYIQPISETDYSYSKPKTVTTTIIEAK